MNGDHSFFHFVSLILKKNKTLLRPSFTIGYISRFSVPFLALFLISIHMSAFVTIVPVEMCAFTHDPTEETCAFARHPTEELTGTIQFKGRSTPFEIHLRSRVITEDTAPINMEKRPDMGSSGSHIILQLRDVPTVEERRVLRNAGVEILSGGYLHTNAWFAACDPERLPYIATLPDVLWMGAIESGDRLSPQLYGFLEGKGSDREWADDSGNVHLYVEFFSDIGEDDAFNLLDDEYTSIRHGLWDPILNGCPVTLNEMDHSTLARLIREDMIQWIEPDPLPEGSEEELDYSRAEVAVPPLFQAPYNLSGNGIPVMIYDSSSVRETHMGLSERVHLVDPKGTSSEWNRPPENHTHATAVAGVLAGDGTPVIGRDLSGMAPEAELYSYWKISFNTSEGNSAFNDAINVRNVYISHNSWGISTNGGGPACVDPQFTENDGFADYSSRSRWFDQVAGGSLNDVNNHRVPLIVFSAGNSRDDHEGGTNSTHPDFVNFGTVNVPKTAKNVLVVGATYDDDGDPDTITTYGHDDHTELYSGSNWGPCDDGRLKPELMAPGGTYSNFPGPGGDDNINTTDGVADDAYKGYLATSMAAPHVSGIAALLVEHYVTTHGRDPAASTLKALLIQGARDIINICSSGTHLNGYVGPDYMTGYGQVRADGPAEIISNDTEDSPLIREVELDHNENLEYTIRVNDPAEGIKITLAWNDREAGTPNDGGKELINDLDLVLVDPAGGAHFPYTLDPANPLSKVRVDSPDRLNNLEQVAISNPVPGWWNVKVSGYSVPTGPQSFSLVSNLPMRSDEPPLVHVISPDGGEVLNGTIPVRWSAVDPNEDTLTINISCNNGSGWVAVACNLTNTGTYHWNTMEFDDGTLYSIYIEAVDDSAFRLTTWDVSNSSFTIYNPDPPEIVLNSPEPGPLPHGSVYINWTADDPDGDLVYIDLLRSADRENWDHIARNESNDGTYLWDTFTVEDGTYWLKAFSRDDSIFTLTGESPNRGPIIIDNPDPPEVYLNISVNGTELMGLVEINWSASDADDDNISISLFIKRYPEDQWSPIVRGIPDEPPFVWNSSSVRDGGGYRFRVVAVDDSPDLLVGADDTNLSYTIYNPDAPVVTNLSVGSNGPLSGTVHISWDIYDPDGDDLTMALQWRKDHGEWVNVTEGKNNLEAWEWDTTDVPDGSEYELRVHATDSSEFILTGTMVSDTFTIYNPDPPFVKVISPGGGDVLGGVVTITWNATDADNETLLVDVEYFNTHGEWIVLVEDAISTDSLTWDTTTVPDGTGYVIRITVRDTSALALTTFDVSNSFRINNPDEPVISIISPSLDIPLAGEVRVTWNAEDADGDSLLISILVSRDGIIWYEIASGEADDGSFIWDSTTVSNGEYSMKITASDGSLQGEDIHTGVMIRNTPTVSDSSYSFIMISILVMIPLVLSGFVLFVFARRKKERGVVEDAIALDDTSVVVEEALVLEDTSAVVEESVVLEDTPIVVEEAVIVEDSSEDGIPLDDVEIPSEMDAGTDSPPTVVKKRVVMRKIAGNMEK